MTSVDLIMVCGQAERSPKAVAAGFSLRNCLGWAVQPMMERTFHHAAFTQAISLRLPIGDGRGRGSEPLRTAFAKPSAISLEFAVDFAPLKHHRQYGKFNLHVIINILTRIFGFGLIFVYICLLS